jgi:hypothetical protein
MIYALCYKPEGHKFETRWGQWIVSIYPVLMVTQGTGDYSASNRNEYQRQNLQKNLPGNRARPMREADNLTFIYEPIV